MCDGLWLAMFVTLVCMMYGPGFCNVLDGPRLVRTLASARSGVAR